MVVLAIALLQVAKCIVIVELASQSTTSHTYIKHISFCMNCINPRIEGSIGLGLLATHGNMSFILTSELVYGVPNHAEKIQLANKNQIIGKIVFLDRGYVEIVVKATRAQNAGAIGCLIADDGTCNTYFEQCGRFVGDGVTGLAYLDSKELWRNIHIPVFLISLETSERLRRMMQVQRIEMPYLGLQNISTSSSSSSAKVGEL